MRGSGTTFLILVIVAALIVGVILVSAPGKTVAPSNTASATASPDAHLVGQLATFNEYDYPVQKQDGKPVIYLFSTTTCPHCNWIKDTFDKWAKDNSSKIVAYHFELDTGDNTLTDAVESSVPQDAQDVYSKFNPDGTVPTFVFGGKYSRVGNAYESSNDLTKEVDAFNQVLDKLLQ